MSTGLPFQTLLARLHLHAVLPALEDLVKLSPEARALAAGWDFSLRLRLGGRDGAAATLVSPGDGSLTVHAHATTPARLTLRFLSAVQLNRTFLNRRALPPLPTAGFWNVGRVGPFTKLAKQLDSALQPSPGALANDGFRELHLRLLFRVLLGAIPVLAEGDPVARHTLGHTPEGTAEIRAPELGGLSGWARWSRGRMTGGPGPAPGGSPDVIITFADRATTDAALLGSLDPNAAVGLGKVDVRGLVPLADGLSVTMDRVEHYLKPAGTVPDAPSMAFSGAAG